MNNFERLINKAKIKDCRLQIRFDPQNQGEEYEVKFYPELDDDAHFYAYHSDLDNAAKQLLDELQESQSW